MMDNAAIPDRPLGVVLDTNVVLDWLVFRDVSVAYMDAVLASKAVQLFASLRSIAELECVLAYPSLALEDERQREVLARYESCTTLVDTLGTTRNADSLIDTLPRCRDADDQYFLALALYARADALVSRDRDLLRLAKRAKAFGFHIMDALRLRSLLLSQTFIDRWSNGTSTSTP
jgi:putative PIN family toxin of toxin-antitoxin system